ncbi:hypothetical protein POM88_038323 [Heracleum sosnowskyi]|uniref:Uncharacterized protein n=1 Tax=Heracleum sosnowskyi TaxID=360622 RepID=A0AAD8M7T4_9APIA|nr:hypothetical protein POM88_038323 [Heracleum sosnowskyi]
MWKGKKRKQEEQTNVYIRKHVEKPKEQSSPQVLQLQSKTIRERKNKKLKLEHVERQLIQQAEDHTNFYIGKHVDKPKPTSEEQSIQIGDVVNLSDLLFTNTRDYLIKYKDNQVVKDEQLAGKGKKRKQEVEEQTNVFIRKHVEKPKEQSSPQVLQLQSKTKREGKNKKLKLGVDPVKLIHQEDKPKGKKRKQTSEEGNKREGKKRKQTTIQIGKHVDKPKPKGKQRKQTTTVQIGGEEDQTTTSIHQIGDVVNLSDLLFTDTRDYLIKY